MYTILREDKMAHQGRDEDTKLEKKSVNPAIYPFDYVIIDVIYFKVSC